MQITNNYSEKIYWRAFKATDTAYVVGLHQGIVDPGASDSWIDDSYPEIKVEVKLGDIVFSTKVLATVGQKFNMSDELVVTSGGKLTIPKVALDANRGSVSTTTADVQFVDLTGFSGEFERTLESRVETAFDSSSISEISNVHEKTWSIGAKVGGGIKGDGMSGTAEVSGGYEDKMVDELRNSYSQTVNSVWGQTWTDTIKFDGGKLHVIEVVWELTLDKGTASYLGHQAEFSVVKSAKPTTTQMTSYASPAELPAKYAAQWKAWTTGSGR